MDWMRVVETKQADAAFKAANERSVGASGRPTAVETGCWEFLDARPWRVQAR